MTIHKIIKITFLVFISCFFFQSCKTDSSSTSSSAVAPKARAVVPKFDKGSAYDFVAKQVEFGPRVPNSEAHKACGKWMADQLRSFDARVIEQTFQSKAYTGEMLNGTNIIGSYNPNHKHRVLLAAHWDSRPIADYDADEARQKEPILGADDGASGVGILLEVARQLQKNPIDLGVDIIFLDLEDFGESQSEDYTSWCLGAQHWGKNLHQPGYTAKFGILLDMAGAKNARFTKIEYSSFQNLKSSNN